MNLSSIYKPQLSLATDLYQITMGYGYWKQGVHEQESCFHLFFRKLPFGGGFAVAAGLSFVVDYLQHFKFGQEEADYLKSLNGNDGKPLFEQGYLDYLVNMEMSLTVDAMEEGTVAYPHEPLLRIQGPLIQAQLVETFLLTVINFQTLVATKAARIRQIAPNDSLLEFGLRRAQGIDGGLGASRAAYIGGFDATSNVLAGRLFGIPVKGTHAHSWVMAFDSEEEAFENYALAMPNNAILLVDTFDTLEGVKKAVETGKKLRKEGYELGGVRLDSGDLAYLSIEARKILDDGGFPNAKIVASNDLDEHTIESLKGQGSTITVWGVGTKLATCYDQPALGGVYKLAALKGADGKWDMKVKLSEQAIKVSNPGILQVKRFEREGRFRGDMIYNELEPGECSTITDPADFTRQKTFKPTDKGTDLLIPIFRQGKKVYELPEATAIKARVSEQIGKLHQTIRRLDMPHEYPVGLEESLFDAKSNLIKQLRRRN